MYLPNSGETTRGWHSNQRILIDRKFNPKDLDNDQGH